MSNVNKMRPKYLPPEMALLGMIPKALWADIAWNFAMQIEEGDPERAKLRIIEEAQIVRPPGVGTWQKRQITAADNRRKLLKNRPDLRGDTE